MNYPIRNLNKEFSETFEFEIDDVARDKLLKLFGYDAFDIWFLKTFKRVSIITALKHRIRCKIAWMKFDKKARDYFRGKDVFKDGKGEY